MPDSIANPFTDEHKKEIDRSISDIDEAEKLIVRGELAGLDLSAQKTRLKETKSKLRKIKQVFFPNG